MSSSETLAVGIASTLFTRHPVADPHTAHAEMCISQECVTLHTPALYSVQIRVSSLLEVTLLMQEQMLHMVVSEEDIKPTLQTTFCHRY